MVHKNGSKAKPAVTQKYKLQFRQKAEYIAEYALSTLVIRPLE